MDDLVEHMQYRKDNPHPGAVIMAIVKSFNDSEDASGKRSIKPKKQRTPEEQKKFEQEQLQELTSIFGNCGPKPKRILVDYVC